MSKKIAIITALAGTRDKLTDPENVYEEADYYAVIEENKTEYKVWTPLPILKFSSDRLYDNRYHARAPKVIPSFFLPKNYEYVIWVDANFGLRQSPQKIIDKVLKDTDIAVFEHPYRDGVYQEIEAVRRYDKDREKTLKAHYKYYKTINYPEKNGLYESGVIFRRMSMKVKQFNLMWWYNICKYGSRDQLSLPFCLDVLKMDPYVIKANIVNNEYCYKVREHVGGK